MNHWIPLYVLAMRRTVMFVLSGCPEEMTIDVVNYVPVAIKPALVHVTSVNISDGTCVSKFSIQSSEFVHFYILSFIFNIFMIHTSFIYNITY